MIPLAMHVRKERWEIVGRRRQWVHICRGNIADNWPILSVDMVLIGTRPIGDQSTFPVCPDFLLTNLLTYSSSPHDNFRRTSKSSPSSRMRDEINLKMKQNTNYEVLLRWGSVIGWSCGIIRPDYLSCLNLKSFVSGERPPYPQNMTFLVSFHPSSVIWVILMQMLIRSTVGGAYGGIVKNLISIKTILF